MILLPVILVFFAATAYLTSILCVVSHWRGRKASLYLALAGALATGGLTALFYAGGGTAKPRSDVAYLVAIATGLSLFPAFFTVHYFRRSFTGAKRISEVRRRLGLVFAVVGGVALSISVILWMRVPPGDVLDNATKAAAMTRAIGWFLVGALLSAVGFYVAQKDPSKGISI